MVYIFPINRKGMQKRAPCNETGPVENINRYTGFTEGTCFNTHTYNSTR